jgi:subtilisin family serine protease
MSRSSFRLPCVLTAVAFGALCATAQAGGRPDIVLSELKQAHRQHVPSELLVQYLPGLSNAAHTEALAGVGGRFVERVSGDLHRVALPAGTDLSAAILALHSQPGVDFAEPNWIYQTQEVADDPYYTGNRLWGMLGDTSETPGNGIDDDGNGFIDDTYGWDFAHDNKKNYDGVGDFHGTHVAGTIGASGDNGKGVVGVCWKVRLFNVKFLGKSGGSTSNAIKSIDYITDLKTRHKLDLVAINASWGGGGFSKGLKKSIERAGAADIVFVAAAGNDGEDGDTIPHYPASYDSPNILSVAAIGSAGLLASFSNYGAKSVDIGAPGVGINSTLPDKTYGILSGTSMAAPHVAGAIALYASSHPKVRSAKDLKKAIMDAAVPTASLAGKTVTGGRLDVSGF